MIPFGAELVDWRGQNLSGHFREFDGCWWYPKQDGRAELLGYLLGANRLNVAEVRRAPAALELPREFVVTKAAQQYAMSDLPIQNVDEAVASELIFSLWIRRRDTHAWNRSYVDGVPVFFDHDAAFTTEPVSQTLEGFFRSGSDQGYVPRWRVRLADADSIRHDRAREVNRSTNHAVHLICDIERFQLELNRWRDRILAEDPSALRDKVVEAGFRGGQIAAVHELLQRSQSELPVMVERMREFIHTPADT